MINSVHEHVQDLAGYLYDDVPNNDRISGADILDALAGLGITLVEDQVGDRALSYFELPHFRA